MTDTLYLLHGTVVEEDLVRKADLKICQGKLHYLKEDEMPPQDARILDATGLHILPGFIDLHVHGGGGYDFMDGTEEAFRAVLATHAAHGTTALCPTTLSAPLPKLLAFLQLYERLQGQSHPLHLLGVHLEGPFLSPRQAGAQSKDHLLQATKENLQALEPYLSLLCRVDLAPECPHALEAGHYFACQDVLVSIAHSEALFDKVEEALFHGYSHVTHLHCATPGARKVEEKVQAGIPEAAYLFDDLSFELIGDGIHVAPQTVELAVKLKLPGQVSLITDAMRAAGCDVTESYLGEILPQNRVIIEGGVAKLPDRSSFAGSIATMDQVFFRTLRTTKLSLPKVCELVSLAPATLLGIEKQTGSIREGKRADLVIADLQKEALRYVICDGRIVYC